MNTYLTLLSKSDYIEGVLVLSKSLLKVNSKYPLHCIVSMDIDLADIERLEAANIHCLKLSKSLFNNNTQINKEYFSYWSFTFDKLQMWGLTLFEKIIYLDCDMIVLKNIDSLFDKKSFTAVCAGKSFPGNNGWYELNSGLLVVEPNKEIETKMIELTPKIIEDYKRKNKPVGDQDVINNYLPDWFQQKTLILDEGYNLLAPYLTYYIRKKGYTLIKNREKPIYIIHFIGQFKPWHLNLKNGFRQLLKNILINPYLIIGYYYYWNYLREIRR